MIRLLLPGLLLGLLAGGGAPVQGGERPATPAACAAAGATAGDAGRCHPAAAVREVASDGALSGDPRLPRFDRQGNAVDRRGRILASPPKDGWEGGRAHEVFSDD